MTEQEAEVVKLVCRRLYDAQKLRIQAGLRVARLEREGIVIPAVAETHLEKAREAECTAESQYEKTLWKLIKSEPIIVDWLEHIRGIGPRLSGLLIANIYPISRFDTAAKLWAYCGLHVIDGKAARRKKGEKANWSAELKTTAYKISESFLKAGGPYREQYDHYRDYIIAREIGKGIVIWKTADSGKKSVAFAPKAANLEELKPSDKPETLGHIHAMALRHTAKLFLSHLWEKWRTLERLPTREPYPVQYLGHSTIITPEQMMTVKEKKKTKAA